MNERLFEQVNAFARATPWLHLIVVGYAGYGVVLFGVLLLAGWWNARRAGSAQRMAAVVCAGAAAVGLVFVSRVLAAAAVAAALLMAFARVYVAAHYPVDVAAGLVLGAVVAVACYALSRRLLVRGVHAVASTRLRPLVTASALHDEQPGRTR